MTTRQFLDLLEARPGSLVTFVTPDGGRVPAHFHVTEVGHLARSFVDCGGTRRTVGSCLLQLWVADDVDHRLEASKLLAIFGRANGLLPTIDLPVEIEFEAPVLTQLPLTRCDVLAGELVFHTEYKHTDCLAKELCVPDFRLPGLPGGQACKPGSGCC